MCPQLKGVQFEISPLAAEGMFQVNAKLLGVQLERVELSLQVSTLHYPILTDNQFLYFYTVCIPG